jgi:hypothetical protein
MPNCPQAHVIRLTTLFSGVLWALTATAEIDPLDDDSLWDPPRLEVSRGELQFLDTPPAAPVHHHQNDITVGASSLVDGWVGLRQCHRDIDRVSRAQILYNGANTEDLEIESHSNIEETWVEGASVQLRRISTDAELCVRARSRMLQVLDDGSFLLENGPFMRRFLDGYHPMRVTVTVDWGNLDLALDDTQPLAQPGFEIVESEQGIRIDTVFEGRLKTTLRLVNGTGSRGRP